MRPAWDFDYAPLHAYAPQQGEHDDLIVATVDPVDTVSMVAVLGALSGSISVTPLLDIHPLFWSRVQLSRAATSERVTAALTAAGIGVRYVTGTHFGSQFLGAPADFTRARPRRGHDWRPRRESTPHDGTSPGYWFLSEAGINVDRNACRTGAGTRLAVIDNDGGNAERLALDAEILVGVESVPRTSSHAALMVGWAVGVQWQGHMHDFVGVAPAGSPRVYCIPKPSSEVFHVAAAIVHAVNDGADVVLCATYVDGLTSPMLDDALEFAARVGRGGRGTAIVMPASREMSSAPDSCHASLSLGMAEPASDPRVFCIGPSSPDGSWFLWRDRKGRLHPFANRGPALRWLAPGDDLAYPIFPMERLVHAETSGASSVAAGVLLLVVAQNPELTLNELDELLSITAEGVDAAQQRGLADLADAHDLLPVGKDRDGHNAKHGYGRLNATLACSSASDPVAAALIAIGEADCALVLRSWLENGRPYSASCAHWMVRHFLTDRSFRHQACALARAVRLASAHPARAAQQPPGTLLRHIALALRMVAARADLSTEVADELAKLQLLVRALLESPIKAQAAEQAFLEGLRQSSAALQQRHRPSSPPARAIASGPRAPAVWQGK